LGERVPAGALLTLIEVGTSPYEAMPIAAQWISEALPATHFMRIIREVILRGADLIDLWKDTISL